jgi:hypothetical protein
MNKRVAYIFSMGERQRYPLGFGFDFDLSNLVR